MRGYILFISQTGHSSTTFAAAEFLRKRYGWGYGIPAYALATFTAYSRVESKNHFVHDVAAGAALGIISSYIFTKPFPRRDGHAGDGWKRNRLRGERDFLDKVKNNVASAVYFLMRNLGLKA